MTVFVLAALVWHPRAQPQSARQSVPAAHRQAVPAVPVKAGVTVTVGRAVYACTVPAKAKPAK